MNAEIGLLFYALVMVMAFLYASVGHGGASGYLALMALYGFSPLVMKPTALLLNIGVSFIAFLQYYKSGHFSWKLFWPLAAASVPAAFVGGLMTLPAVVYKQVLGVFLLVPAIRFLFFPELQFGKKQALNLGLALFIGGGIGLLSGMIGIGGGILLSPLLILMGWADLKQSAAVSALFIFVNSLSGLGGQMQQSVSFSPMMYALVGVALTGGLAGAYGGAFRFEQKVLKICLSVVLLIAALKLLLT